MMLALEWADTVRRRRKLTRDPRKARPDAANLPRSPSTSRHGTQGKRRDGAPEGAPAPLRPVISGPDFAGDGPYRETGHGCARTTRTSVSLRSISPHLSGTMQRERGAGPRATKSGRRSVGYSP